jgi:hypothetical protein
MRWPGNTSGGLALIEPKAVRFDLRGTGNELSPFLEIDAGYLLAPADPPLAFLLKEGGILALHTESFH